MAIPGTCKCGKTYQAKDELAGRQLKCPACGEIRILPQPASPEGGLDLDDHSGFDLGASGGADPLAVSGGSTAPLEQYPKRSSAGGGYGTRPNPTKKLNVGLIVAAAGGGVAVIALLIILFVVFVRSGDSASNEANEIVAADTDQEAGTSNDVATASLADDGAGESATRSPKPNVPDEPWSIPDADLSIPEWAGSPDEPFDVRAYLESRMPPRDDPAPMYREGLSYFNAKMAELAPELERAERVKSAKEVAQTIRRLANAEKLAAGGISMDQIEAVIRQVRPALELIDRAQQKADCVFVTGLNAESMLYHAQSSRELARLTMLQVYLASAKGELSSAEQPIQRCLRLSRDIQRRGSVISFLVSNAVEGVVYDTCRRFVVNHDDLSESQCDRILKIFQEHQQQSFDVTECLRMEYVFSHNMLFEVESGRMSFDDFTKTLGLPEQSRRKLTRRDLNLAAEKDASNRWWKEMINRANLAYNQRNLSQFYQRWRDESKESKVILSALLVPSIHATLESSVRTDATLSGTLLQVAIRNYHLRHGQYPESAQQAIQGTSLASVPIDPYVNQPMKYVLRDGKPLVYSVGNDLQDDGGKSDWKFGIQPGDFLMPLETLGGR